MSKEHSHAQVLRCIADGKTVEFSRKPAQDDRGLSLRTTDPGALLRWIESGASIENFRLAPRTIKVGSREINAPMDVASENGHVYYGVVFDGEIESITWVNDVMDRRALAYGNVWATEADATAARDAWRELMKGQV